ncbi:MAG: 30S ribosomal protein S8 [bacterium]|jgi:small subunit ribosomal protein S8
MAISDPIADMLTVIRNGCKAKLKRVEVPASKLKQDVLKVLLMEKFINNYKYIEDGKQGKLRIYLKYTDEEKSVISGIQKISTPGLRRYTDKKHVPRIRGGLGIAILTTSHGVMTGKEARHKGIGGEVLCRVW